MKNLIAFLLISIPLFLHAQQGIVATGGDATGSGGTMSSSTGLTDFYTIQSEDFNLQYGIQQAFKDQQNYELTLNLDMSHASDFDLGVDAVYVTGSFWGDWIIPGDDPDNQFMTRVGETTIWTKTFILQGGEYEYKYFLNAGWNGAEWEGPPNRSISLEEDSILYNTWGMMGESYPVSFNVTDYQGTNIPNAVIEVSGFTFDVGEYDIGYLPDGNYPYNVSAEGYLPSSGTFNIESESIIVDVELAGNELTISGSFTAFDKISDGTTDAEIEDNNLFLSGVIDDDDVELVNISVEFSQSNVGDNITVLITNAYLAGEARDNYTLTLEGAPTTTASIVTATSIDLLFSGGLLAYPNPFYDYIYLKNTENVVKVSLTNISGQKVLIRYLEGEKRISTKSLTRGIYFLIVEYDNNTIQVIKMLKE